MIKLLIFIFLYHITIHNNLEKMLFYINSNYINVKRPLEKCNNNLLEPLRCFGMPSGHAEIVTIITLLLYKNKYISIEIAILLIFIFSSQRIISNMHTIKQVLIGILLGLIYSEIYNSSKYSIFIPLIIGFIFANLIIIKVDSIIKETKIPEWVSKEMYSSIEKKQNISHLFKVMHIYYNCFDSDPLFISWNKLEYLLDIIIERIKKFEIDNLIKFDAIVGIKTGGAILSDYISYKLGIKNYKVKIKKNCKNDNNNINNYIKNHLLKTKNDKYVICEEINDNISNFNIILIDEVISSGNTIKNVYNYLIKNKKVNFIYQQCIFIRKPTLEFNYIYKNNVPYIYSWGYDN